MKATTIISKLKKNNIQFLIANKYNDYNKEICFNVNGVAIEADITTGFSYGFITENGRVYTSINQIIKLNKQGV
jgi:hypothetical protein